MYALITGTTNGIGNSIAKKLLLKKIKVIGIDKSKNKLIKDPNFKPIKLNILNEKSVFNFVKKLELKKQLPNYFILNAGINNYDNKQFFDIINFRKSFDTNFFGVVNFISAIEKLKIKNKKIVSISSVSIIVPNINSLGYFSSKLLLSKNFSLLNFNKTNIYKQVILGPVKTKISRNLKTPHGIGGKIYRALQIPPEKAAEKIINFIGTTKKKIRITNSASLVYYLIKFVLIFAPGLYLKKK